MPPSNSRYTKSAVELSGKVAKALGYKARRLNVKPYINAEKRYEFEVRTLWGKVLVRVPKKDPQSAIEEACPAFTESHAPEMLAWLGRKAVHHDFEFSLKIVQKNGAKWAAVVKSGKITKTFRRSVKSFPASMPIAEAVAYVYKEVLHGD